MIRQAAHALPLLTILALSAIAAGCAAPTSDDGAATSSDQDLRDAVTADNEHPEVGMLFFNNGNEYCTATAVGARTIITASHCAVPVDGAPEGTTCLGDFRIDLSGTGGTKAPWQVYAFHTCARFRVPGSIPSGTDLAIIHLDTDLPAGLPIGEITAPYPTDGTRTIYGYGHYGAGCKGSFDEHKRKETIPLARSIFATVTCPGDSGGPHFLSGTQEIVGIVSGDMLVQVTANPVAYADWVNGRIAESEANEDFTEDAVNDD